MFRLNRLLKLGLLHIKIQMPKGVTKDLHFINIPTLIQWKLSGHNSLVSDATNLKKTYLQSKSIVDSCKKLKLPCTEETISWKGRWRGKEEPVVKKEESLSIWFSSLGLFFLLSTGSSMTSGCFSGSSFGATTSSVCCFSSAGFTSTGTTVAGSSAGFSLDFSAAGAGMQWVQI